MKNYNHCYHMVTISPWPLMLSINILNMIINTILFINMFHNNINLSLLLTSLTLYQWWRDIIRESTFQGFHSFIIKKMLKLGMILFIISELLLFISFFWMYFHNSISPSIEIGSTWPPKFIICFDPFSMPLLNSIILISSGFSITWSHYCMLKNNFLTTKNTLLTTIILGMFFSLLQLYEYNQSFFCYNDNVYGSMFYLITGFHGSHVNIGIIMLMTCLLRLNMNHFSKISHLHFEFAAWYWHFVDIIWLFVYLSIYWWMY